MYSFYRRDNRGDAIIQCAKQTSLREFIRWLLSTPGYHRLVDSFQVGYCAAAAVSGKVSTTELLEQASRKLQQCPMVGTVERMDESLALAECVLKQFFPGVDLSYVPQNVTPDRQTALEARRDSVRQQVGDELWEELVSRNRLDHTIHQFVSSELDRRIQDISGFTSHLANFRSRCDYLGRQAKGLSALGARGEIR
jgi:hypothetical protein